MENLNLKNINLFTTPVLFLVFNRPDVTKRVFEVIRGIRPSKLYIAADGPRASRIDEGKLCDEVRKITEAIDWPCEVKRKYADNNIGSKKGIPQAISWFFENEFEGIILEDDCLPNKSFFYFCQELLSKYKDVEKVKMISGNNFQFGKKYGDASYYFSSIPSIWGWATWRRAWSDFDIDMKTYPEFKKSKSITKIFRDKNIQNYWLRFFNKLYTRKLNSWDSKLVYSIYNKQGVSITPNVNLISNIGFDENATNTKNDSPLNSIPTENLNLIIHPKDIIVNQEADKNIFYNIYYRSLFKKILDKIKLYFKI